MRPSFHVKLPNGSPGWAAANLVLKTSTGVALPSPHYSRALLLQSPIRCCDEPSAGGLAFRALDVLHEYASGPQGSARQDTAGSPTRRRPQAWLDLFVEPRTSRRGSAISRRTVMNNAG
ncbi:hypothetical protein NITMOv2_3259 [Nitrospira moscoviensis]|uniref:Uncharacterized protein n=1 Tax=Nitrospira moscoviensis TaxID=42253 RepID=A0A0K2GFM5_NITMO|nr:hypothetical protein NITMOv2_3259 [Nitrospira moscoviensis]